MIAANDLLIGKVMFFVRITIFSLTENEGVSIGIDSKNDLVF